MAVLLLFTASCASPTISQPTPTTTAETSASPTSSPLAAPTRTVAAETTLPIIERVTFAAAVEDDGAPKGETTVFPQHPQSMYLCILARNVRLGSQFRAVWYENQQRIGQSDKLIVETNDRPTWVSLGYFPIAPLDPSAEHSVALLIDDTVIEQYVFRIGTGDARDIVAAAAFAAGFDTAGKPIGVQERFNVNATELKLRVRISNQVDPTGMLFTTLWYRGNTQIAQLAPDAPASPDADPRRINFTHRPSAPLVPGSYRVALLVNGNEIDSIPFEVTTDDVATPAVPTPTPTVPAPPTSTPPSTTAPSAAQISNIAVASQVDPVDQHPLDGPLFEVNAGPDEVLPLWVAVEVRQIAPLDILEIVVWRNDEIYAEIPLPQQQLDYGWISAQVEVVAPPIGTSTYTYVVAVRINGERALDTTLQVHGPTPP